MKTEAQKRAQKKYMDQGMWKQISVMFRIEDVEKIKKLAQESGIPVSAYIKDAVAAYSGEKFSWNEIMETDDLGV